MWRSRMFWQLFGAQAGLIAFSLGLFSYLAVSQMEHNELVELQARLHAKALLIQEALRDREPSREQALLERIRGLALPTTTRVTLIARDGTVLAEAPHGAHEFDNHADRPEVAAALVDGVGRAVRHSATTGSDWMYLALRADLPGSAVAVIRVAYPLESVRGRLNDLRRLLFLGAALTALIALGLAVWLAGGITRPLRALISGAETIAAGNYGQRVYTGVSNEVGILARTFNHMSDRLAEQFSQLEDDRQQLRTVLSSMVEGVIAVDAEQRILFANERAGHLLDFPLRAALGRHLWEMVRQRTLQEMLGGVMSSQEFQSRELTWNGPGARSLTVHVARLPGPSRGAVLVFHDTSELRRLERLRQEFVANVSHELKTPLAIIQACVETLIDGAVDDVEHRGQFLERVATETRRLDNLTSDLLQLARVETETEVFTREPIDVAALVEDCLGRHRTLAAGRGQTLASLPPADGAKVVAWADEEAMLQILNNLVNNALKYTPEGGQVTVAWRREQDRVILEVRDTGIGIAEADLPRVFERFYRVDKARSREMGGTGLGLSIVKHLAHAMHGHVRAASVPGQGSTFTVELPAARE